MGPAIGPLLVQFAISVALSIAVSFVLSALRPKPKGAKRSGVPSIVRNPVEPQRVAYGRARVGGALVFASTTGQDIRSTSARNRSRRPVSRATAPWARGDTRARPGFT